MKTRFEGGIATFFGLTAFALGISGNVCAQSAVLSGGGDGFNGLGGSLSVSIGESVSGALWATGYAGQPSFYRGQSGVQQPHEWLFPGLRVKAQLHYLNALHSPLGAVSVQLRNSQGQSVASGTTDPQGTADLGTVADGNYSMVLADTRGWSGVNGTDALLVNRSFTGLAPLSGLYALAGDVNANSVLTNGDALMIMRRVSGHFSTFGLAGDWRYSTNQVQVQRQPGQVEQVVGVDALFAGDVNGSYVPGIAPRSLWMPLVEDGMVASQEGTYEIPLRLTNSMDLGAVTLWLELPQGMEVQNVRCNRPDLNGALVHRQEGSSLGLVWYGLAPWAVKDGEVIFVLEARGKATGSLKVDRAKSELANGWGEVQEAWQWSAPGLRQRGQDQWQITAYPNPFESYMALRLSSPMAGKWQIEVRDLAGRLIWSDFQVTSPSGHHEFFLETENWSAGAYKAQCRFESLEEAGKPTTFMQVVSMLKRQ